MHARVRSWIGAGARKETRRKNIERRDAIREGWDYNVTQKVPPSQLARLRLLSLALRSCRS